MEEMQQPLVVRFGIKVLVAWAAAYAIWFLPKFPALSGEDLQLFLEVDFVNALAVAAGFVVCYPILVWRSSARFRGSYFLQPMLLVVFDYVLLMGCRLVNIPFVTPLSYYITSFWPMGHFGFVGLYVTSFVFTFLAALLVRLVDGAILWKQRRAELANA